MKWTFASTDDEMIEELAADIFPDMPLDQAVKRFKKEGDNFKYVDRYGEEYYALDPGLFGWAQGRYGRVIPAAGALGGMLLAARRRLPPSLGGSVGGVTSEAARQKFGDYLFGAHADPELNGDALLDAAVAGGLGAVGRPQIVAELRRQGFHAIADILEQIDASKSEGTTPRE